MNAHIVFTARKIRASYPGIALSDALTYADASTVQGRAFRSGNRGTFYGTGYSKIDLAFAFAWYFTLWGDARRNHVRGVSLGVCSRLETEGSEVKRAYGEIVRSRNALLVGFERYRKRAPDAPAWPGTYNMPRGVRAWLQSHGILAAVEAYAPTFERVEVQ